MKHFKFVVRMFAVATVLALLTACVSWDQDSNEGSVPCTNLRGAVCKLWEESCCIMDCDMQRCLNDIDSTITCRGTYSETNYDTCMAQLPQVPCIVGYETLPNSCRSVYTSNDTIE